MSFTHLQVKSGYSFMDSMITIENLVRKAEQLDFSALALTDHHVLYGVIPFYKACRKRGIKPIIGMTADVSFADGEKEKCILIAKNNDGYKHLLKLSTYIHTEIEAPLSMEELNRFTGGLLCVLPVMDSRLRELLMASSFALAENHLARWQELFDEGDLYLGVQDHGLVNERRLHETIKAFHKSVDIPACAIQDVHYLDEKDAAAYDCLLAVGKGETWQFRITDPEVKQRHLCTAEEMNELFGHFWPELLEETNRIADKCTVMLDFDSSMLPAYPLPDGENAHACLTKLCRDALSRKYETVTKEISERLEFELSVIQTMQFSDYFLIVWDFIAYAKKNGILVGPGRGSAAGSLVAFTLGITNVDPIRYGLLFERFLNPERVSMPDIDVDFSDRRRDEVIQYVADKYGHEHVAQIITFGTYGTRSIIRDLIKTIGVQPEDAHFIMRQIPQHAPESVAYYVNQSEELKTYIKQSEKLKALFAFAVKMEGLPRNKSTHAAGVIISEQPLADNVPLTTGSGDIRVTQYPMNDLEAIGLLKMDFLGLRNLTLLEEIIRSIRFTKGIQLSLDTIPDNDGRTFMLLQKGKTNGVFQFESDGMKQVLTRLKPTSFEDIVAVNALYRPGPMEYIPVYINRKNNKEEVTYPHPDLAPILEKTYGVLVYQEQIMQIAHQIAGLPLGEADILRRAVSKKDETVMAEQKEAFICGCLRNGYTEQVAKEIFLWIVKFSNYGFNRSHAVAYSKIAYQLAYLKTHYPADFFAAMLSSTSGSEKTDQYLKEARALGLEILPPSIHSSYGAYAVEGERIRIGLLQIKGIGMNAVREIIRVRKEKPFKDLFDFCLRVSLKIIGRQQLELLIMAGAFDEIYANRASLLASIEPALEQGELFREFSGERGFAHNLIKLEASYADIEDFGQMKKLADEKELLGVYVSSHPLKNQRKHLRASGYVTVADAETLPGRNNLKIAAVIQEIRTIRTRRGDPMAFMTMGDETGDIEAVIFPEMYRKTGRQLEAEGLIFTRGKVEKRNGRLQWLPLEITPFDETLLKTASDKRLFIRLTKGDPAKALHTLRGIAELYPGDTPVIIHHAESGQTYRLAGAYYIAPAWECMKQIKKQFGEKNVVLKK